MNPVNATSLYVSVSRSVLQCDPRDPRALAELCKLLPFFRQSLSCLVCGNLLQDPIAPTDSSCQHYVCRGCKGQRMQLKPSCSWCKDYSRFEENRQLSLLVHCYRKLCLYITQSPLAPHIASAASQRLAGPPGRPERGLDAASTSEPPDDAPPTKEPKSEEPSPVSVNGLHDCNGLVSSDSLQPITIETGGGVAKQESFSEEIPVCVSVTGTGEAGLCDISTFGDDLKHGGGPLLLSVEEVLRTLETDADPDPNESDTQLDCPPPVPQPSLNGPRCPDSSRLIPSLPTENSPRPLQPHPQPSLQPPHQPSTVVPHTPPRYHCKRSRSESDSEKVQPLPISSLLRAPPLGANSSPHHPNPSATTKQEPKFPAATPHPHLAPVPNGGPPKVGKTVLVPNKALKKTVEHHGGPKKAYTKARQGAPKPRTQPRDRACLDCICRGCQNSYMANGEKKLEAFAVPAEKALEQTRLTLGINLTSITAAALRSPATSSPGNTLLNVTTATGAPVTAAFLSGAGHDNRGFDDSLEMRFDC
ncbi:hypothetical protein L3Q82_018310 [Scortum barcoo]|uniref:Uncharacterized protein n=1 Tax=Scortum barcoo TaxID=214431 RepID=A0ACB8VLS8_9TELE|nr:hypothetical protein L3Q82_018310 [Scortum barcoo]